MKQTLRIQFEEQAKAVVAMVDLTIETESTFLESQQDAVLNEAKRLFEEAQKYATHKTFQKNR